MNPLILPAYLLSSVLDLDFEEENDQAPDVEETHVNDDATSEGENSDATWEQIFELLVTKLSCLFKVHFSCGLYKIL